MRRAACSAGLIVLLLTLAGANPTRPAPPPNEKPTIRLVRAGELKLDEMVIHNAAVIDEDTLVVVGRKGQVGEFPVPDNSPANGAILDLKEKKARPFTNGHEARITSVSVSRGRVATTSTKADPVLRIWDLKAARTVQQFDLKKLLEDGPGKGADGDLPLEYAVTWFHKRDRLAVSASEYVLVFDPARPDKCEWAKTPLLTRREKTEYVILPDWFIDGPVAISPDDSCMAAQVGQANVVFWLFSGKMVDVRLTPRGAKDSEHWSGEGVIFNPSGELFAWRSGASDPESKEKAETDVPPERHGVVRIELVNVPEGKLGPPVFKRNVYPVHCAIDPSGRWLATVSSARPDKPRRDDATSVGELRIYDLSSKELVYREQVEGPLLAWVAFTPAGKRVVAATGSGIRWWDVKSR